MRRVVAFVAVAIVLAGVALIPLRLQFSDANARRTEVAAASPPAVVDAPPAPAAELVPPAPPPAAEPPPPPPEPVKAAPPPPQPRHAAPAHQPAAAARKPVERAKAPTPPRSARPPAPPVQVARQAPRPVPAPPQTAKIVLNVSPWGDVYVNGKRQGTTPPLSVLELPPGRHRLEIRNSARPPYLTEITLQAGASVSVQYTFQN
jgi:non-specific serine/threonine protein kinase